jgi:secretion/DNA translocation related TadE-like protein
MTRDRRKGPDCEGGNSAIVMLAGAGMVMVLLIGLADLASYFIARTRAQTAADSAALAAVAELIPSIGEDPEAKAEEYANANGAKLLECSCSMGTLIAEVKVAVPVKLALRSLGGMRSVEARAKAEISMPSGEA